MVVSPKRILWSTDFSELSLQAARYARGFREVFGAELHVLHVMPPPLSPDVGVMLPAEYPVLMAEPELLEAARTALKKVVADQFTGAPSVVIHATVGHPWSVICDYAQTHEIDLIIVATHGRTGLRHVLIGSTAERIVQHAPCPVLTVKEAERDFLVGGN